jgi:hypothetical protein
MSHKHPNDDRGEIPPEDSDTIARLLRLAGPRPAVPAERAERVKSVVLSRWRAKVRRRRRVRWALVLLPAAAALAMAFSLWPSFSVPPPDSSRQLVARLAATKGTGVQILPPRASRLSRLAVRGAVFAGATVLTGADGRGALQLTSGVSLRMDTGTRVRLISPSELILEKGAVYLDNPSVGDGRAKVVVHTTFAIARDVGTQFELRLVKQCLRLRVREGMVVLDREDGAETADAGVELTVARDEVTARRSIPVYGAEWEWVTLVAPRFDIEGRRLDSFLAWIARETGRQIQFESEESQMSASNIVLHGTINGLSLDEALATVLPTCGLTHRVSSGKIYIGELDAESFWR